MVNPFPYNLVDDVVREGWVEGTSYADSDYRPAASMLETQNSTLSVDPLQSVVWIADTSDAEWETFSRELDFLRVLEKWTAHLPLLHLAYCAVFRPAKVSV